MKGRIRTIEPNIYQQESGKYQVEMNYTHPETGRKSKKRRVFPSLTEARRWKKEFKAQQTLGSLPVERTQRVTLGDMIALIKELKADRKTFDDIERHLGDIETYFQPDKPLAKITTPTIKGFSAWLKQRPKKRQHKGFLSNQSIDHVLKELRYLLREAHKRDMIDKVPEIPFVGNHGHREFTLDLDGFLKVVNHLPEPPYPHRAMLLMALNTGQRRTDLSLMTWDQIKAEHVVYRSSKTQREGIPAPLMPETKAALDALREHNGSSFIFVNPATGLPLKDVRKSLTTACRQAGVERFTMHHMRHLATTVLLEETNGDRDLVKRVIGWSSMDMIERYGHIGHRAMPAFQSINARVANGLNSAR